jgi:hypothetical protein
MEMRDLILTAFEERRTQLLGWDELRDYCAAHSSDLRRPLHPQMDWRELVFTIHQGLRELHASGAVRITRRNGWIETIERIRRPGRA